MDLLQETMLKALRSRSQFLDNTNFRAWTFTIMKNTFINSYRRRIHQRNVFDRTPDAHYLSQNQDTFYDVPDSVYSAKELSAMISKLGDEYRAPLQMHIAGYKYKEIADDLATAIANTNLILQLEKNLEDSQKLHQQYLQEAWKEVARESENYEFSYGSKQNLPADASQEKVGSEYSFPLKLRDQEIGQLILELDKPELKDEEKTFIEAVTNQAAVALENARLIEKNQRQASYERLLSDVSRKVNSSTDLDTILQITLREIGQVMKASDGMIQLKIPTGEEEAQL